MNKTPKGCSNIGGSAAAKLEYCRNSAMELFALYGYRPFSPSELQLVESVWDNLSKPRARRLIPVMSPFGEPCVLRGDLTLSAVAYLSSHFNSGERPLRLSYADRVFSVPQPPKSNLEENQAGVELIGWEGAGADAEVVSLLFRALDRLSIEKSVVVLGDVSVLSHIFKDLPQDTGAALVDALQACSYTKYLELLKGLGLPEERDKLLRALPALRGDVSVISEMEGLIDDISVLAPLKKLCGTLSALGYEERLRIDFSFVRDLGYYSGPIFNAYSSESGVLLGGGGRYDGLLSQVGIEGQAAGFALNLKELSDHCADGLPTPSVMLWCGGDGAADALLYADGLSKKGISFELSWSSDRDESLGRARLRGYGWWVDLCGRQAVSLTSGETTDIIDFERDVMPC